MDTCCIDKSSSTELSEAINSMFRWYRDSAKCYAFLADVPTERPASDFQKSKWFTRGWTLQELLAPETVEFYAANGRQIGDKTTLADDLFSTTGIPTEALHGGFASLSQFSVEQRLSWANGRDTKREEDAAYSLLGLFDLAMPLIYGEGRDRAFRRLHREREIAAFEKDAAEKKTEGIDDQTRLASSARHNGAKQRASEAFGSTSQDSETAEEVTNEQHAELMQVWWDDNIEDHLDPRDQYQNVAVLLLKWSNALDDLRVIGEVRSTGSIEIFPC